MKATSFFLAITLLLTACVKENTPDPGNNGPLQSQSYSNVSYGSDGKQSMDVYLPQGRSADSTNTMVITHGGGWTGGDKNDMKVVLDSLKKRLPEYALINVNYRLAANGTSNLFPTQENDIKAAVEFYLGKSEEYNVSKNLVLVGASAGAHLALLHGYKNDPGKHVKAVVDYFGPTDLHLLWNSGIAQQWALAGVTGKSYEQDTSIYIQSSPVNFITPASPPTIVVQGGADPLVPASQSDLLISRLAEKSIASQLVSYPSGGHGDWPAATYTDSFDKIQAFIADHVN